ncbi:MAG TPA: PstS family phosphate ABC transporter substrate-binding protein [Vicinamibacterales bacterium]|nr:PstS family phosphate ABC transporter substrate-binding protein [Vicinamibacterales bacterium]
MRNQALAATIAIMTLSFAGACRGGGDPQSQGGAAPQVIAIDGSSTVFPIGEAVAEEFQHATPGARVTVGTSGTGGGFQKFCRGETDMSNASRPIKPAEADTCRAAGIEFIEIPLAYDGLSVVVHPNNTWVTSMTAAELKKLWQPEAQRKVMRWSQVRQGWPDREIRLYGPGTDSGTFDYFTEAINGKSQASRGDFTASEDDNVLVQGVSGDENALGYFGFAYYEENKNRLKLVPIDDENPDNGAGPIAPSEETVRNGTYSPLSRPMFMYVNTAKLSRPEIKAFVDFLLAEGAPLIRDVGYVPLSDAEQQLVRARWTAGTTGSMYTGAAHGASLESLLKGSQ